MPIHPYIPNSVPEIKKKMLEKIGVSSSDILFSCIPESMKFKGRLNLPTSQSEQDVLKHITSVLSKNQTSPNLLSFLGAGCWPHFIPAVC